MPTETVVDIRLFPEQRAFVDCGERFSAAVSGVRGGKTRGGAVKAMLLCARHAGIVGMVTAPIYKTLLQATLPTIFEIFPRQLASEATFNKGEMTLHCANGSMLYLRSTEDPESLRGPTAGFFWMDEAALSPMAAWLILQGRLSQPSMPNCGFLTTTPKGFNWVYQEFQRERPGYKLFTWSSRRNHYLPPEFIPSLEASYTDPEYALQEIEGQWVMVGGACFFDVKALQDYLLMVRPPLEDGLVKRWQRSIVGRHYCIGVDPAAGIAQDRSVIEVLDWQSGQQVVEVASSTVPPDELAKLAADLGTEYNKALVGVEGNQSLAVISKLKELAYHPLYEQREGVTGWSTNSKTRPVMLAELAEAVRQRAIGISSRDLVDEMFSFVKDSVGRTKATEGAHDDRVMAMAIAWQMRKHSSGPSTWEPWSGKIRGLR